MERDLRPRTPQEGKRDNERVSGEELGNLLSAFGNHEIKAITLGLMHQGNVYTERNLNTLLVQASGGNPEARMNKRAGYDYCENSLSPVGLVTREMRDPDLNTYGYGKTPYGEKMGDPLAGLLLDFSLKYPDFSLQDFFGNTATSSKTIEESDIEYRKRAPMTRIKLFWELLTRPLPARAKDIAQGIDENERIIGRHLASLSDRGIVEYESIKQGKPRISYKYSELAPSVDPVPYRHNRGVTEMVYNILRRNPDTEWTHENLREEIMKYLSETGKEMPSSIGKTAEEVLSYLANTGYAKRGIFSSGKQSDVSLNEGQRNMIYELVSILDKFQNGDSATINYGKNRLGEILANTQNVSSLIIKAREHSSNVQRLPIGESADHLKSLISSEPKVTADELWEKLKNEGRLISKTQLSKVIRILLAEHSITATIEKGVRHFEINTSKPPKTSAA